MKIKKELFFAILFMGGMVIMADEDTGEKKHRLNTVVNDYVSVYPEGDIIVMDFYICANFSAKMDTNGLEQFLGEYIGEIKRTGTQNDWKKFDATVLKTGTKLYQHRERHTIIIAVDGKNYIPYLDLLE
jgi:hypothetical protein